MSSPHFDRSDFFSKVHESINSLSHISKRSSHGPLSQQQEKMEKIRKLIDETADYKASDHRAFKSQEEKIQREIKVLSTDVEQYEKKSGQFCDDLKTDLEVLAQSVHLYVEYSIHSHSDKSIKIEEHLDEKWGRECFEILLSQRFPKIYAPLEDQARAGHPFALKLLFIYSAEDEKVAQILNSLPKSDALSSFCKALLQRGPAGYSIEQRFCVYETFERVIKESKFKWLYDLFITQLTNTKNESPVLLFLAYFFASPEPFFELYNLFFSALTNNEIWAHRAFAFILKNQGLSDDFNTHSFWKFFFQKVFDENLSVFLKLTTYVYGFDQQPILSLYFKKFLAHNASRIIDFNIKEALRRQATFWSQLLPGLEKNSAQSSSPFLWLSLKSSQRCDLFLALIESELKLIQFLLGGLLTSDFVDEVYSDGFHRPKQLMLGHSKTSNPAVSEICKVMRGHGVTTISFCDPKDTFTQSSDEVYFYNQSAIHWIRDYLTVFQNSFRLNAYYPATPAYYNKVIVARTTRIRDAIKNPKAPTVEFLPMGKSSSSKQPLRVFSSFKEVAESLNRKVSYNFLLLDGGNVLRGSSKGSDYALVGRDTVEFNRPLLAEKLSIMGLKYERGRWHVTEPYSKEEAVINDEILIKLLCCDLGLENPDQVVLVENTDYHLDVHMMILDEEKKVVALNSSEQIKEIQLELLEKAKNNPSCSKKQKLIYEERAKFAIKKAIPQLNHELAAKKDLESRGFTVVSYPSFFYDYRAQNPELEPILNFNSLNFLNSKGEKEIIILGTLPELEQSTREFFHKNIPNLKKVHFIDRKASVPLMQNDGGLHCFGLFV